MVKDDVMCRCFETQTEKFKKRKKKKVSHSSENLW